MQNSIVEVARTWLGTPFHAQGRVKGIGCDCLGLLMGIAKELNLRTKGGKLLTDYDQNNYHLILDGARFESALCHHFEEIDQVESGCIVLLEFDNNPQHLAIVVESGVNCSVIHAYATARKVVEHRLDGSMRRKIKRIFRIWY